MTDKTLQQRLRDREGDNDDDLIDAAADALDAQEKRIKELEGGLRDFLAWDDGSHDGSPAAHHDSAIARARALMGEK